MDPEQLENVGEAALPPGTKEQRLPNVFDSDLPTEFKLFPKRHVLDLSSRTRASYVRDPSKTREQHVKIAERELRALRDVKTPLARAALVALLCDVSPEIAAEAAHLSEKSVRRAMVALKEGREPGVPGRPRSLSSVQDTSFKAWLRKKIEDNRDPTIKEALEHAFSLKKADAPPGIDVARPQKAWLMATLADSPDLKTAPVHCLEEVRFFSK